MAHDSIQEHLETMLGPAATFHRGQREAIDAVLRNGARVLVVQRTGWGKSLVYWIATRVRRDSGGGPTLIVSPLLSLMRNQIQMAERLGLRAVTINSSNVDNWADVEERLEAGEVDVLLISPERLANQQFLERVLPTLGAIGMVVVDEAHCISDWGHDFRPDYRRLARVIGALPPAMPVLATTATANDRVVEDVAAQLGGAVEILRGPLTRASLALHVIALVDQSERLAWLAEHVPALEGTGIVYCLTVADSFRVTEWLMSRGISALAYNASVSPEARLAAEEALLANRVKALVATTALGMGFDKPDLGFVVHYQRPGSAVAYYQQVGRAGRAVEHADAILLTGREDDEIAEYFIDSAFPPIEDLQAVVSALEARSVSTIVQLEARLNLRHGQIEKALKILEIDGAAGRDRGQWFRTPNPWAPDVERISRVTALRRSELAEIQAYTTHTGCLMEFLAHSLDDPEARRCGRCGNDGGVAFSADVRPDLVEAATTFLRRDARPIEPRKQWPFGAVAGLRGRIAAPNNPGMALSIYNDAGWGAAVREGKYVLGEFPQTLVAAAADLIRRWGPEPPPTWVTAIPSANRPMLVTNMAQTLADTLGLPFIEAFAARDGFDQKTMQNSHQQLGNVAEKLELLASVRTEPVLLVDDIIDSGWTMTYAGSLLAAKGVPAVYPFALAVASSRGDT